MSASSSTIYTRSQASSISLEGAGPVALLGRLLFVLIFLMSAPMHFTGQTVAYAASQGVPLASIAVPLSGVIALAGGLSILLGYRAKLGVAAGAFPGRCHANAAQVLGGVRSHDAPDAVCHVHEEYFHAGRRSVHLAIRSRTVEP